MRTVATAVVSLWIVTLVYWPRNLYYALFPAVFLLLGYVPYRLRRHRLAEVIKLIFVVLDVVLVVTAILVPPPAEIAIAWPVQTRLRGQNFLYLLLLLGEAALTYSPRRVVWTGVSIVIVWSIGCAIVYGLPDTVRIAHVVGPTRPPDAVLLRLYTDPNYVSVPSWFTQVVATALFTLLLSLAVLRGRMHMLAQSKSEIVRADLARYVSPDVAGELEQHASSGFGEPTARNVAVLFADIVGFTAATERLSPERTFALLRSFQERSAAVVLRHRGTLDKYIGDGLMATFGALHDEDDAAARAIASAFALIDETERWNRKRRLRNAPEVRVGIGLHWGPVVVGNLGSEQRIEFTVVGDVVNVASRLEKSTRELGCTLATSDACVEAAAGSPDLARFDRQVTVQLRGRQDRLVAHIAD